MATLIESTLVSPRPGLDLYRMTVDEYERLAEAAILDDPRVELIDGCLVRKISDFGWPTPWPASPSRTWSSRQSRYTADTHSTPACPP